jgi:hypothetical protein
LRKSVLKGHGFSRAATGEQEAGLAPEGQILNARKAFLRKQELELGKHDTLLLLVLALAIRIAGFAGLVAVEEQDLAQSLVGIDLCRQRRGV